MVKPQTPQSNQKQRSDSVKVTDAQSKKEQKPVYSPKVSSVRSQKRDQKQDISQQVKEKLQAVDVSEFVKDAY